MLQGVPPGICVHGGPYTCSPQQRGHSLSHLLHLLLGPQLLLPRPSPVAPGAAPGQAQAQPLNSEDTTREDLQS